ncbi:hypothetical protein [Bradyrhizobium sp. B120]|uniref:hypothetical protein n=1 Tax=Bradyrhizobium sp. B120 TaxID=3410088 RepID=UPI003B984F9B
MGPILSYLGLAATGVMAWFAAEFIGRPIRTFFDLRMEVRRQMLFLANVQTELPKPFVTLEDRSRKRYDDIVSARREKSRTLRELGARMLAYAEGERFAPLVLHKLGYDPHGAGSALIGLSNHLSTHNEERARFSIAVGKTLRFPD